ncbi:NADH-quinone oxidoreductase subunit NuoN [Curvibacter sp. CHRR-16]|uniref:NADH-quinone oxidoreductase subunit NuoN n=1 Tax=Curvibacter sp. CHRR-16 TaxID=2835872 RepID=UPI001BDAF2C2|nr:NADH-quinone oxidoreductase subunit NuoN [Curvibacter sp. CHRR-16]MBT0571461.1 NADH-quinone oxidoreductase subunit NuoN [Curvibacter sp. CHRR-16]
MMDKISFFSVLPEAVLFVMASLLTLIDLRKQSDQRNLTFGISVIVLLVVGCLLLPKTASTEAVYAFGGLVVVDAFAAWSKVFATVAMLITWVYSREYLHVRSMTKTGGEFYTLSLFALLGIFVMISGNNFLTIYLGLELLTLSSYALVALRRDDVLATEAAMKYFVLGAMASGFLLYGMSMLYGASGTLSIPEFIKAITTGQIKHQVLVFGLVFVAAGLAFKLGVVPFHMWIPDVYQGAPTAITLMIGGAPKLAAFAILVRLLVEGLLPLAHDWQQMLLFLAVASLIVGNLAAIAQDNFKRMLAFSTIAQMGFVLIGFIAGVHNGDDANAANAYSSSMFYVVAYVLTTLVSFGVVLALSSADNENERIADFAGLNKRSPMHAGIMTVALLSLAGIPPMIGFYAKLAVLQALLASQSAWALGTAIFAVLMSVIGAFYYLRVIKVMYFDEPTVTTPVAPVRSSFNAVLSINGLALIVLGMFPAGLMAVCADAMKSLIGG